jgi:1-acyl-sn-glycerol-3-phosphate acyltransferase
VKSNLNMTLKLYVLLCYFIPVIFINFPIGLVLSYFLKIAKFDKASNRINNSLAYFWLRTFLFLTRRKLTFIPGEWNPNNNNRFLISNHTNSLEVPLIVSLPYLTKNKDVKLSYLGGDIIQRYKIIPLMMHSRIVDAVIYSEKKPNFRDFKTRVLEVLKTRSIFLYPEGRRTFTEEIKPFETGVMKIAYKYNIDLDIFVVSGMMGYSGMPVYSHLTQKKEIYFEFCGTVHPSDFSNFDSFLEKAMSLMISRKKALEELERS